MAATTSAPTPAPVKMFLSPSAVSSNPSLAPTSEKKFRFDSFAEEFACKEEDIGDNDSGIGEYSKRIK